MKTGNFEISGEYFEPLNTILKIRSIILFMLHSCASQTNQTVSDFVFLFDYD